MEHLSSLQADKGGFSGFEGLAPVKDKTEGHQTAALRSQFSPPMIWCEHASGLDSCAERENFSKTTPVSYSASHLPRLTPSEDCRETEKQESTGLPVYDSTLHEE